MRAGLARARFWKPVSRPALKDYLASTQRSSFQRVVYRAERLVTFVCHLPSDFFPKIGLPGDRCELNLAM
jgi:hypothetical protein